MLAPGSILFFPSPGRRGEGLQAVTVTGACTCPALSGPGPPMLFVCFSPLSPGVLIPVLLGSHGSALLYLLPPWGPSGIPDLSAVPITPFFHPLLPPITILSHGLYQALGNCPLPIIGAVTPAPSRGACAILCVNVCVSAHGGGARAFRSAVRACSPGSCPSPCCGSGGQGPLLGAIGANEGDSLDVGARHASPSIGPDTRAGRVGQQVQYWWGETLLGIG